MQENISRAMLSLDEGIDGGGVVVGKVGGFFGLLSPSQSFQTKQESMM